MVKDGHDNYDDNDDNDNSDDEVGDDYNEALGAAQSQGWSDKEEYHCSSYDDDDDDYDNDNGDDEDEDGDDSNNDYGDNDNDDEDENDDDDIQTNLWIVVVGAGLASPLSWARIWTKVLDINRMDWFELLLRDCRLWILANEDMKVLNYTPLDVFDF